MKNKFKLIIISMILSLFIVPNGFCNFIDIGTDAQYAPFTFRDENGKIVGFDIDIMNVIAERLGLSLDYKDMNFDGLVPALLNKNIDVIASSMVITKERAKRVAFTDSYYKAGLSVVVNEKNTTIKSIDDLVGKTVGVKIGTVSEIKANTIKDVKIVTYNDTAVAYIAVAEGKIDATINDNPMNLYYINTKKNKSGVKIVGDVMGDDVYGFGVSKKNPKLLNDINDTLKQIKKDGTYNKIYKKWFN